jgi:hypothetical protein
MKFLILTSLLTFFSFGANAKIAALTYTGGDSSGIASVYDDKEIDQMFATINARIANLESVNQDDSKRIGFLENRMKKTEAALEQEIVTPESIIAEIKGELREELKAELKAELLKELAH